MGTRGRETIPGLNYWAPSPAWYRAARARLDRAPAAFERLYDHADFTVYRVHLPELEALHGGDTLRPFVRPLVVGDRMRPLGPGLPELVSLDLQANTAALGDTVPGVLEWHVAKPLPAGSYLVAVRFDRPLPAGVAPGPASLSKVWRKLVEKRTHERYRFRADHLPTDGAFGVDRWTPDHVVRDSFRVVVPADVAPGEYAVKVTMSRKPHYPNLRLRDFLSDNDFLNGVEMARLRITRPGAR